MPNIMDDFPSKYLKGHDVEEHPTVTIRVVTREMVGDEQQMKPILFVDEYDQGIVLNKTNAANISRLYGQDTDDWPGKKVVLGTEMVTFNGQTNPAIRIWPPKRSQPVKGGSVNAPIQRQVTQQAPAGAGQRPFAPPDAEDDGEIPFAPEFR